MAENPHSSSFMMLTNHSPRGTNPMWWEFDADGVPLLEAVQDAILPAVRKYGWSAVMDALFSEPLYALHDQPREGMV